MSIYKRGGVWWGRVQVAGREHRRSLRTGSKSEARERFEAWKDALVEQVHFGIERHSWPEAVLKWSAEILPHEVAPSTGRRYLSSLATIRDRLDHLEVHAIDKRVLAGIARRPGVSPSTCNRDVTAVMSVLKACEQWGWIADVPTAPRARERRDPIVLPPPASVDRLVARCAATGGMLHHLVMLLRQTGVRLEEAGGLTWAQVDLTRGAISLPVTKRNRLRVVPLTGTAAGTLQRLPRRLDVPWVFWHGPSGSRYLNLSSRLRVLAAQAGFKNRLHDLRHLYAVEYLMAGGSIYDLQKILGHKSIRTTEIYLDFLSPEEQVAAQRIGA